MIKLTYDTWHVDYRHYPNVRNNYVHTRHVKVFENYRELNRHINMYRDLVERDWIFNIISVTKTDKFLWGREFIKEIYKYNN